MKRLQEISAWCIGSLFLFLAWPVFAPAQDASPIGISLVADKASYLVGESIRLQIRVANLHDQALITRKGFFNQKFHLLVTFTGPDGQLIRQRFEDVPQGEPGPPYRYLDSSGEFHDAAPVELIPGYAENSFVVDNAHLYYDLLQTGRYTAEVAAPMETFSAYASNSETGEMFGLLNDPLRRQFNPVLSNRIAFEIRTEQPPVKSSVRVKVSLLSIGSGTKPKTTKNPLSGVPVHLIKRSSVPPIYQPINFKTYQAISQAVPPLFIQATGPDGVATFGAVPQDDYVVIALYDGSQDFRHMGGHISAEDPAWGVGLPVEKNLMVMQKANGKKVPGTTTVLTGSQLLITEPEYVEWGSDQELYPFVFETTGNWTVVTSVVPPEGFVADYSALKASVLNEQEAVQFVITDVGSKWEETGVTFRVKHKRKKHVLQSRIGVKLSEDLAKRKALGIYGDTPSPGTLIGGKVQEDK